MRIEIDLFFADDPKIKLESILFNVFANEWKSHRIDGRVMDVSKTVQNSAPLLQYQIYAQCTTDNKIYSFDEKQQHIQKHI